MVYVWVAGDPHVLYLNALEIKGF